MNDRTTVISKLRDVAQGMSDGEVKKTLEIFDNCSPGGQEHWRGAVKSLPSTEGIEGLNVMELEVTVDVIASARGMKWPVG